MRLYLNPGFFIFLVLMLTRCSSYQVVERKVGVNSSVLSQLKVNRKYKFELESERTLRLHIDSIRHERIYGRTFGPGDLFMSTKNPSFSDSFENINNNVLKISRRRFNPFLTFLTVGSIGAVYVICTGEIGLPGDP